MADEQPEELIHGDENYVAEQERAAAEDAASIGGDPGDDYEVEEAERALAEAGGGVAEGFELAEEELIDNATHEADESPDPMDLTGVSEDDRADSEYGEPDTEPIEDA